MEHGTRYDYVGGCRCTACRDANAAYQRGWARDRSRPDGEARTVDAAPVRARLAELTAAGWTHRRLSAETGVSRQALDALAAGRTTRVRRSCADAIDSVAASPQVPAQPVDAAMARRVVEVLHAAGYTDDEVVTATGTGGGSGRLRLRGATVSTGTWRALATLVAHLGGQLDGDGSVVVPPVPASVARELGRTTAR